MRPTIPDGALVTVAPVPGTGPRIGDIVLARDGDRSVVHRVIGRSHGALRLKGDLNPREDPPITPSQVLGRVVRVEVAGKARRVSGRRGALLGLFWAALSRAAPAIKRSLGRTQTQSI